MANANCAGENLLLIGTLIAIQIAQCVDSDGLALLGGLFTVIGDQLALLSITKEAPDTDSDDTEDEEDSGAAQEGDPEKNETQRCGMGGASAAEKTSRTPAAHGDRAKAAGSRARGRQARNAAH